QTRRLQDQRTKDERIVIQTIREPPPQTIISLNSGRETVIAGEKKRQATGKRGLTKKLIRMPARVSAASVRRSKCVEFGPAIVTARRGVNYLRIKLFRQFAFNAIKLSEDPVGAREQKVVFGIDPLIAVLLVEIAP